MEKGEQGDALRNSESEARKQKWSGLFGAAGKISNQRIDSAYY
jgi:hypothetical protein